MILCFLTTKTAGKESSNRMKLIYIYIYIYISESETEKEKRREKKRRIIPRETKRPACGGRRVSDGGVLQTKML